MSTPPGTIGLTHISGPVGKLIELGQWLNNEGFKAWEHAFVMLPGGMILEAEPGGAVIVPNHYADVYWCDALRVMLPASADALMPSAGRALKGVPYSFLDYGALAAHRLHLPLPFLKDFIEDDRHMICSQLCDEFYLRLGANLFDDGRWPGYVTPASLYQLDQGMRR